MTVKPKLKTGGICEACKGDYVPKLEGQRGCDTACMFIIAKREGKNEQKEK